MYLHTSALLISAVNSAVKYAARRMTNYNRRVSLLARFFVRARIVSAFPGFEPRTAAFFRGIPMESCENHSGLRPSGHYRNLRAESAGNWIFAVCEAESCPPRTARLLLYFLTWMETAFACLFVRSFVHFASYANATALLKGDEPSARSRSMNFYYAAVVNLGQNIRGRVRVLIVILRVI